MTERDTVFVSPFFIVGHIVEFLREDVKAENFEDGSTPDELEFVLAVRKRGKIYFCTSHNLGDGDAVRKLLAATINEVDMGAEVE